MVMWIRSIDYNDFEISDENTQHVFADNEWKTVVYPKRNRKQKPADQTANFSVSVQSNGDNVFRSLEEQADDRRRRISASKSDAEADDEPTSWRSNRISNGYGGDEGYDSDDTDSEIAAIEKTEETKKKNKPKKENKPKVSLPEAASQIDSSNLEAFLIETAVRASPKETS
ncbi:unnamed protein product [Cochlearia groenlandica]